MEASAAQPQTVSPQFLELLGRALTDSDFRELLYNDREAATREYSLTDIDEQSLDEMTRERLEEHLDVMAHSTSTAIAVTTKTTFSTP
jgi:hypothetical protein